VSDVSTAGAGPTLQPLDILIVDDEPDIAAAMREFLDDAGYRVQVSGSVAAARRALGGQAFAMALVDLSLPDGSGLDLMREAGGEAAPPDFVVVTGNATLASAIAAVEAGAAGYILKPIDFGKLTALVGRVLALRKLTADNAYLQAELTERLRESEALQVRLSQIFASTSDGIMLVDGTGHIAAANARLSELLGLDTGAVGRPLVDLFGGVPARAGDDLRRLFDALPVLESPGEEGDLEVAAVPLRVLHWVARSTTDAAGARVGVTLTLRDVTHEREVTRMKSDFVGFVTHQLRTPLAGIKWLLELAAEDPSLPAEAKGYVEDSRAAAERLITLVNDLVDISRLEGGRLAITPVALDLGDLTRDALGELEGPINAQGHRVSVTGAGSALADHQLFRQVVLNLVSNATKYTAPGGRITIRIDPADGKVTWAITDTGIGIPLAARPHLFEKFYRANNVQPLETEGTGLGLYLVRLIVEQLGGHIRYDSVEGEGTTFIVTLPAADGAP